MTLCPRCRNEVSTGGVCAACLLHSTVSGEGLPLAERIFQAALTREAAERADFIQEAAGGDGAVLAEVEMLLAGYAEAGGDDAAVTVGTGTARSQWAAVRREEPGTEIGHFRLVKMIGEGGMGSVWEAEQLKPMQRRVALKIIKLGMDTEEVVQRFERERRTLARLTHPHIAQVYEAGATPQGRPFFAMELVEGKSITAHCTEQSLSVQERVRLFLEVCSAVEYAHQRGVIHRDLKPSNIMVASGAVKVIDFGIAKATQDEGDSLLTLQQQVLGTPAYMSPEQAESEGSDVDTRTDVYSLGAVLYELLCGRPPHDPQRLSSTGAREMHRILREEDPPRPSTRIVPARYNPPLTVHWLELKADLDWITMKALRKEREHRYPSAAAFADDLRRYLDGEAVSAAPPALAYRFGKFVRRNRAAVAAVAAVVLSLAAGLIFSLIQMRRTAQALKGEAAARAETTFTVADLYTRSGLTAAEKGEHARAALWFAHAARIAAADPERASANHLRAATWTAECRLPVAGLESGLPFIEDITWHPGGRAFIAARMDGGEAQLWDLDRQAQSSLLPEGADSAAWDAAGSKLCAVRAGKITVMEYPGGRILAERDVEPGSAVALSPDGTLAATGGAQPFLWAWTQNETKPCAAVPGAKRIRWSTDGRYVLHQNLTRVSAVEAASPERQLFPPVSNFWKTLVQFAGSSHTFLHSDRHTKRTWLRDAATGEVIKEATGSEWALSVSREAHYVAFASAPLWSAQSANSRRNPVHRLSSLMEGAGFSPDDTLLATSAYDASVRLWDVAADRALGEVGIHQHPVQCVSWSPDGSLLASAQNGLVRVWRVKSQPLMQQLPADGGSLAAISADGKYTAASGWTVHYSNVRKTQVYEIATGRPAGPEMALDGVLMDAAFASENEIALAVSTTTERSADDWDQKASTGYLELRNWRSGVRVAGPVPLPSEPRGLAIHPAGTHVAISGTFGESIEWERATGTVRSLCAGGKACRPFSTLSNGRCAYTGNGRWLVAWGAFESFTAYDRTAGREVTLSIKAPEKGVVHDAGFHGTLITIAPSGPVSPQVPVLDLTTGQPVATSLPHSDWMYLSRFDETGAYVLTTGRRPMAQVWDWRAGRLLCPALPHSTDTMAGLFVPGTPWVITGSHDGLVRFWDRRSGMMIRPPVALDGIVLQLNLTPDGRWLIVSGNLPGPALVVIDMQKALPAIPGPDLTDAELNAAAVIHESGGIVPLTGEQWLTKWRSR
jgi:eukaryotic-like serine/threonine-protein kinase